MQNDYESLLDASIAHLEQLKTQGTRFLLIEKETLGALSRRVEGNKSVPALKPAAIHRSVNAIPSIEKQTNLATAPEHSAAPTLTVSREAKETAMKELGARASVCIKCPHLVASRKNVVFGVGNIDTELMFVGEAPGAEEDAQGEPFVGAAGQLLTRIIQTMGFSRETIYIANILKCRPNTPGQSFGNRKPTPEEMNTCMPYLLEQIKIIQPKVIVALGATALEGLFGKTVGISKLRGNFQTFQNIPVMPTFHPSYLLRNQALTEKRKVWEDMLQVMEKLNAPISEKQRNFFLKS